MLSTFGDGTALQHVVLSRGAPLVFTNCSIGSCLATQPDFVLLQTIPGIGPILAMIILAEARDLRRFGGVRQFLKYCGFDLCTE